MPGAASLGSVRSPAGPRKQDLRGVQGCGRFVLQGRAVGGWALKQGVGLGSSPAIPTSIMEPKCV